jgi:hypothetical protein
MSDGAELSYVIYDEMGSDLPRREMIVQRPNGSTYSANVPADMDLGELLATGEVVGFDGGSGPG